MKSKKNGFLHVINVVAVALIIECFLCSMLAVRSYAREDCLARIAEVTVQMSEMFNHGMDEGREKLTTIADILAANSSNPDELLQVYMKNFCRTQDFTALCIHRANGTSISYGEHPHDLNKFPVFEDEAAALPYVSQVFSTGNSAAEAYFYQAVPIVRNEKTIAILYGYMSLDKLPQFLTASAYDGKCQLYIVDGDTGNFMLDTWHEGPLGNIFDGSLGERETRRGYDIDDMRDGVRNGKSGYFIFRSHTTGDWFYTYYMPLGINNWSIQLTIDEPTAFAGYNKMSFIVLVLFVCVVVQMLIHLLVLMMQSLHTRKRDQQQLQKANYMYDVQRALLNAHNNPDGINQALHKVADRVQTETVLLLSFSGRTINSVYYWPSKDKSVAHALLDRNIRDEFPVLFDQLSVGKAVAYDTKGPDMDLSETALLAFRAMEVSDIVIVPIADPSGMLKGALCAVNRTKERVDPEMLRCVTYDFFMAVTNIENHEIIKQMSTMDYLTKIKNRNSYEAETATIAALDCKTLWCVFVDVNGLHEVNNTRGHKAGDLMLCTVADEIKRIFGSQYTYRLGGDEFVAFAIDGSREEFQQKKETIMERLAAKGYYVSVGFEGIARNGRKDFDLERVVADAEAIMYRDKWEYYQENGIPSERGHFPALNKLSGRET